MSRGFAPGIRRRTSRIGAPRRTPSGGSGRAAGSGAPAGRSASAKRPARASRARNSSNSHAFERDEPRTLAETHHQRFVAQRQQARRLQADDGRCRAGQTPRARASAPAPCLGRARPCRRSDRSARSNRARRGLLEGVDQVAGGSAARAPRRARSRARTVPLNVSTNSTAAFAARRCCLEHLLAAGPGWSSGRRAIARTYRIASAAASAAADKPEQPLAQAQGAPGKRVAQIRRARRRGSRRGA